MFGSKPAFGTPAFGTTATSFGNTTFGGQQQPSSLFGAAKPTVSFGQPSTGGGLFGGTTTTASSTFGGAGTSLFGNPSSSGAFGGTGSSFFGASTGSTAFQAPTSVAPSSGFGFGNTSGSSLFSLGTQNTQQPSSSTGLFGNTMTNMGASNMFGTQQQTSGTVLKYSPLIATDQMMKNNTQTTVSTRHQCISAMKEYENKSLEELRVEDYLANRKGPQQTGLTFGQPTAPAAMTTTASLFGAPKTTFGSSAFGAPSFGTSTGQSTFGTSLFSGQSQQSSIFGANKSTVSFGQPTTQTAGGFFGTTTTAAPNIFGGTGTNTFGTAPPGSTFGTTGTTNMFGQPSAPSLFSSAAPTPFQTGISAPSSAAFGFGNQGSLFASTATQPAASTNLFGNNLGTATSNIFGSTSQPSSSFKFGPNLQTNQVQQPKPFGSTFAQPSTFNQPLVGGGGFFNQNPAAGGFGNSLLSNQAKPATFNSLNFGSTSSNFGTSMMASVPPQNVTIGTDNATFAAQQALLQSQLLGIAQSPYGDSALLKLLKGKRDDSLPSPTDPVSQRQVLNAMNSSVSPLSSSFIMKPLPPARPSPRVLSMTNGGMNTLNISKDKKSLFDDFESDTITFKEGFVPKRNVKKLILNRSLSKNEKRPSSSADTSQRSILSDSLAITTSVKRSSFPLTDKIAKPLYFDATATNDDEDDNVSYLDASPEPLNSNGRKIAEENESFLTEDVRSLVQPRPPISSQDKTNRSPSTEALHEVRPSHTLPVDGSETRISASKTKESLTQSKHFDNNSGNVTTKSLPNATNNNRNAIGDLSMSLEDDADVDRSVNDMLRHSAQIVCHRDDYYTVPSLAELKNIVDDDGRCVVDGFTIGRKEYGSIFWPDTLNVAYLNLDQLVHFRHKEVTVYPDDANKPPVGFGLNRKAEITLERVWPNDKTTHLPIKDPKRLEMMRYRERLERASTQMNAKFLAYRPETGSWVFQVPHFSKYGLGDDADDDEPVSVIRVDRKIFRRAPTLPPTPADGVGLNLSSSTGAAVRTVAQITQPKNVIKLLPYEKSLLCGRHRSFFDSSCFNNRRFRVHCTTVRKFIEKGLIDDKDALPISVFRTISRTEVTLSRDFTLNILQPMCDQRFSTYLVETLLSTQFVNASRIERQGCTCFVPSNGVELTSSYVSALSGEGFAQDEAVFVKHVFRLCEVLWGELKIESTSRYVEDMTRKALLTEWLSEVSQEGVNADVKEAKSKGKESIIDAVFSFLTSRQLEEAAQLAFDNGDIRLSILLTQLGGSEQSKTLFRQQLAQWFECQADQHIDATRLKIYSLLGGILQYQSSSGQTINACERLDWIRCLGLNIWYRCHSCCTIGDALKEYDLSWSNSIDNKVFASPPIPIYLNRNEKLAKDLRRPIKEDVCYHLIKLFSDRAHRLEIVLNNETWTSDPLSYYLSWHLWCVLSALGYTNMSEQSKNQLHLHYSAQLEQEGMWPWSVFVLLHITDDHCREKAVKRVLSLWAPSANDDQMKFMRDDLFLPESWVDEAKALKERSDGNKRHEMRYQMKASGQDMLS